MRQIECLPVSSLDEFLRLGRALLEGLAARDLVTISPKVLEALVQQKRRRDFR